MTHRAKNNGRSTGGEPDGSAERLAKNGDELVLDVENIHVHFNTRDGIVRAVNGLSLKLHHGETLGLVGESGCGKSQTARAILNMVPSPGRIVDGTVRLYTTESPIPLELTAFDPEDKTIRRVRGKNIAMIFQEPMASLSPVHTIGNQIIESIRLHDGLEQIPARNRAVDLLGLVGIPDPGRRLESYSFQLSGGMRQRAMIAMALSCNPSVLIADEPTTALDVTIQAQILQLLHRLQGEFGMSILLITHNLAVVAATAHRVAVMYMGRIVEEASTDALFAEPKHPYTIGLLRSVPQLADTDQKELWAIKGNVPNPYSTVKGCPFHPRCDRFMEGTCDAIVPELAEVSPGHKVSCLLFDENARERATAGERSVVPEGEDQ